MSLVAIVNLVAANGLSEVFRQVWILQAETKESHWPLDSQESLQVVAVEVGTIGMHPFHQQSHPQATTTSHLPKPEVQASANSEAAARATAVRVALEASALAGAAAAHVPVVAAASEASAAVAAAVLLKTHVFVAVAFAPRLPHLLPVGPAAAVALAAAPFPNISPATV